MFDVVKTKHTPKGSREPQAKWWAQPEAEQHRDVFAVVKGILARQKTMLQLAVIYAGLYENIARYPGSNALAAGMLGATNTTMRTDTASSAGQRATHNVVMSCVDTATAKIAKNKPRVKYQTNEGSWTQQQRARQLTQFTDGLFRVSDTYQQANLAFRDACVWGLGVVHVFVDGDEIKTERVIPTELVVDEVDGQYGKPQQIHRRKLVPRDTLIAMFPEHRGELEKAATADTTTAWSMVDEVLVIESYHLPSKPASKRSAAEKSDGRHTISIEGLTLESGEWDHDWFPYAAYRWADRLNGFWGRGLAEELWPIQYRINVLDKMIAEGIRIMCAPRCFVPHGALMPGHKAFDFGVVTYKGPTPPTYATASAMPAEVYQERENEIQKAYRLAGISELSASAQKPAGLNSGAALEEYQDQASERFSIQGERWEGFFVELARIELELAREMHAEGKKLSVIAKGRTMSRKINLADVLLEESEFTRSAFPVSQLPNTPAGRLQYIQQLAQAGYIDRDVAMELLRLGDVDDSMSLLTAAFDDAMMAIDKILEDGEYIAPEPYMNLTLTLKLAQSAYLRAQCNGAPEERMTDLRTFMTQIRAIQQNAQNQNAQAAPAPGVGAGQPTAQPAQAPTSDMLPVAA